MDLIGQLVHFKVRDVFVPDPEKLLLELYGDQLLQGTVDDLSDSGMQTGAFAVVRVEGIEQPVIVPVERIQVSCE